MKIKCTNNLYSWLLVIGIFTERYIEVSIISIICFLMVFYRKQIKVSYCLILTFVSIFLLSFLSIYINQYSYIRPLQQFLILLYYCICYSIIFRNLLENNDVSFIFDKYLFIANIVALIGLLQFFVYLLFNYNICGFIYNSHSSPIIVSHLIRITSVLDEPGYCALLLTPAFVYYFLKTGFDNKIVKIKKWAIYISVFLTFSAATYLILFCLIAYYWFVKNRYKAFKYILIVSLPLFLYLFSVYYSNDDSTDNGIFSDLTLKLSDTVGAFHDMDPYSFELLNLSSYSTMTNVWVAINAPTRLIGTGIGTHSQNYELLYKSDFEYYGLNKEDGYSLFNRIYSEFGVLGIVLLLMFLYKNGNRNSIINISVLLLLMTLCIRGGNYVRYGTVFFFFLYYNTRAFKLDKR